MSNLEETIEVVREDINPKLKMGAVYFNRIRENLITDRSILEHMEAQKTSRSLPLLKTRIRMATVFTQAELHGQTVLHFSPSSRSAAECRSLVTEIVDALQI